MGKIIETLCLNGPHKGTHKVELDYTEQQQQEAERKMVFTVDGIAYGGWCRKCGAKIRKEDTVYQHNVTGLGVLKTDAFHRDC